MEDGNGDEPVYKYDQEVLKSRTPAQPIHPMILSRRSLRSMTGQPISDDALITLFEAAHWAPSHYNCQSWRFIYAKRETDYWKSYFGSLTEENRTWAKDASVLVVIISKKNMQNPYTQEEEFVSSHRFEAGSAFMAMALEGTARGLVVHAVNGFDLNKVKEAIGVDSEEYQVEVMIAIGVPDLYNAEWEEVTMRREIELFVSEGIFVEKVKEEEDGDGSKVMNGYEKEEKEVESKEVAEVKGENEEVKVEKSNVEEPPVENEKIEEPEVQSEKPEVASNEVENKVDDSAKNVEKSAEEKAEAEEVKDQSKEENTEEASNEKQNEVEIEAQAEPDSSSELVDESPVENINENPISGEPEVQDNEIRNEAMKKEEEPTVSTDDVKVEVNEKDPEPKNDEGKIEQNEIEKINENEASPKLTEEPETKPEPEVEAEAE